MFFETYALMVRGPQGEVKACLDRQASRGAISWQYAENWSKDGNTMKVEVLRTLTPWFFVVAPTLNQAGDWALVPSGAWLRFDTAKDLAERMAHNEFLEYFVTSTESLEGYVKRQLWQWFVPFSIRVKYNKYRNKKLLHA